MDIFKSSLGFKAQSNSDTQRKNQKRYHVFETELW